ncbi:DUF3006 family protein [Ornithinibacillus sp. 4-3]|uniref:DUF3006 family protein n=1 Tax=Ornithinibacillus sp. 4-3 TaxID=3231488 RepID=A0AB39HTN0_9BACI
MKGFIDRFIGNEKAVILIEELGKEIHLPLSSLPNGCGIGSWVTLAKQNGIYEITEIDHKMTIIQKEKVDHLTKKLEMKKKKSKFRK